MVKLVLVASIVLLVAATAVIAAPFNDLKVFGYNPVANPKAVIVAGTARFTILTDAVIRMEYSHTGTFEDRATIAIVNRNTPVPLFTNSTANGWLTIATSKVTLKYQIGQQFASYTLTATTADGGSWAYGDKDTGNLLGTIRSLDELCTISLNCDQNSGTYIHDEGLHCEWGVISRGGWTTIVDTANYILSATPGQWFNAQLKNVNDNDIYFFGHGSDYRKALGDLARISGSAPLQHRNMLGSWYTRWYDFDNSDIERLIGLFEENSVPLDTLVLDMNWHTKNDWTGYSWDRQLFPIPNDTVAFLHNKGLRVACNLHDADGVGYWEETYPQMCSVMGINPSSQAPVPFAPLNESYMHALEDITLASTGFDFWWIDWQQGGQVGGCPGGKLNPTIITNHVRGTDSIRRGVSQRDAVLARYGGLGSQRYPVGFSGDVSQLTWECFAYQPFFSATAANVGYMWSHDLVGPADDHELHVRWMQFGAFSSVMRIHDRGMSAGSCYPNCPIVNVWKLPYNYFSAVRDAMNARVALLPYMYTAQRVAYDTGVQMVHPVYFDWPDQNSAYIMGPNGQHAQYMFGDSILVAPVCVAGDSNGLAAKTVWLPPVQWYDNVFGELIMGGTTISRSYDVSEIPLFFRAGSVIPRIPNPSKVGVAAQQYTALDIYIYPGASSGSYSLYEDDGASLSYIGGAFGYQNFTYTRPSTTTMIITVSPASGSYANKVSSRKLRFVLEGHMPLQSALVNGATQLSPSRFPAAGSFYYDAKTASATIDCGDVPTSSAFTLSVTFAAEQNDARISRMKGYASRTELAKRLLDDFRETPYGVTVGPGMLKQAGAHAVKLSYEAMNNINAFTTNIGSTYTTLVQSALSEIGGNPNPPPPAPAQTGLIQMYSVARKDMLLCGTVECTEVNFDYEVMWTEGYQPLASSNDRVTFYDYFSNQYNDNWADVTSDPPADGYLPAIFDNGFILSNSTSGAECLQVWYNPQTNDHMTLASPGMQWALNNGYIKIKGCIGYVFTKPPVDPHASSVAKAAKTARDKLRDQATSRAQELLQTVLPQA